MSIIQVTSSSDLKLIFESRPDIFSDSDQQKRVEKDFEDAYFQAFFYLKQEGLTNLESATLNSISAYVITYFSYSTWQHRVLSIADFWLNPSLVDQTQSIDLVVEQFKERLFAEARKHRCKRVNFLVSSSIEQSNKKLIRSLEQLGMVNLSKAEDWNIFQLGPSELAEFVQDVPAFDDTKYKMIKVENEKEMGLYAGQIQKRIHELAVYEKLEEQFQCTVDGLIGDYTPSKCPQQRRRMYESIVIVENQTNEVVGFAIYFPMYNLKSGLGFYLEDLYIREAYRRSGLGTSLWKKVAKDCIRLGGSVMQWSVLGWNKSAISFYFKFKACNLTDMLSLQFYRFLTNQIYENFD